MLHKSWSRSHLFPTPLVNLSDPILDSRRSIEHYLEWVTDPVILRANCNDLLRGVHDTVTPIPPQDTTTTTTTTEIDNNPSNYRLFPPISLLNLESNSIGWMGISILSACLNVSLIVIILITSLINHFSVQSVKTMESSRRVVCEWKHDWNERIQFISSNYEIRK